MNIPNLPDSLHKSLFIIGLICVAFAYYEYDQNDLKIENELHSVNGMLDDIYFQKIKVKGLETDFQMTCWEEAHKLGLEVKDFCENDKDGELDFYRFLSVTDKELRVSDSLNKLWQVIETERESRENLIDKHEFAVSNFRDNEERLLDRNDFNSGLGIFGVILAFIGIARWWRVQTIQDEIIRLKLPKKRKFEYCQSCSRNFSFRVLFGTKADGSESDLFCSDCYYKGVFTEYVDAESIKEKKEHLLTKCKTKFERKRIEGRFKNLRRWTINDYD
jgi:hypothetical protein